MNSALLSSLTELDTLCELFSFFTEITVNDARSTCRWWNDLLSKDKQTLNHTCANNSSTEAFLKFENELKRLHKLSEEFRRVKSGISELATMIDGKTIKVIKNEKTFIRLTTRSEIIGKNVGIKEEYLLDFCRDDLFDVLYDKLISKLVIKSLNDKEVHLFKIRGGCYVETSHRTLKIMYVGYDEGGPLKLYQIDIHSRKRYIDFFIFDSSKLKGSFDLSNEVKFSNLYNDRFKPIIEWLKKNLSDKDWFFVSSNGDITNS
jgi:hypothetical protein